MRLFSTKKNRSKNDKKDEEEYQKIFESKSQSNTISNYIFNQLEYVNLNIDTMNYATTYINYLNSINVKIIYFFKFASQ